MGVLLLVEMLYTLSIAKEEHSNNELNRLADVK